MLGWTTERFLTDATRAGARRLRAALRRAGRAPRRPASRSPTSSARREFWGLELEVTPGRADSAPGDRADRRGGAGAVSRSRGAAARSPTSAPAAAASRSRSRTSGRRARCAAPTSRAAALEVARRNAARHGVGDRVTLHPRRPARRRRRHASTRSSRTRRTSSIARGRRCSRRSATTSRRSRCSAAIDGLALVARLIAAAPAAAAPRRLSDLRVRTRPGRRDRGPDRGVARADADRACAATCRASRAPPSPSESKAARDDLDA